MITEETNADGSRTTDSPSADLQAGGPTVSLVHADPSNLIVGINARRQANLNKRFVADIKRRGVRQPITARRREDGALIVREGQRRTLAAIEAGCTIVPVLITGVHDEDGQQATIERIVDQLGENEHREDLGGDDELAATQQLLDLGLSARQIASRRSISRTRATTTAAVARSAAASQAVTEYGLDLVHAAALAEFDDDEAAQTELREAAFTRPGQLEHIAQRWRDQRAEEAALASMTVELTTQGITVIDRPYLLTGGLARLSRLRPTRQAEPGIELAEQDHVDCPGHAVFLIYSRRTHEIEIVPVCTDFVTHGHAELRAPVGESTSSPSGTDAGATSASEEEREAKKTYRRQVIAHGKAWDSATELRRAWLSRFAARRTAPKDAPMWTAQAWASGAHCLRKSLEHGHHLAGELLGISGGPSEIARTAEQATPGRATVIMTVLALAAIEDSTDRRNTWEHPDALQRGYFARIQQWGYEPAEVEALVTAEDECQGSAADAEPDFTGEQDGSGFDNEVAAPV